jgi:hypothetical protein
VPQGRGAGQHLQVSITINVIRFWVDAELGQMGVQRHEGSETKSSYNSRPKEVHFIYLKLNTQEPKKSKNPFLCTGMKKQGCL